MDRGYYSSDEEERPKHPAMFPDRSKSDFYCDICDAHMHSPQMWESHIAGKRHLKNVKKEPGVPPSKVKAVKKDTLPKIQRKLDRVVEEPLVGLSYMCETQRSDPTVDNVYNCYLCHANMNKSQVIEHAMTSKHRMYFFKKVDPRTHDLIEGMHLNKGAKEGIIEEKALEWEEANGREIMEVKAEKPKSALMVPMGRKKPKWQDDIQSRHDVPFYDLKKPSTSRQSMTPGLLPPAPMGYGPSLLPPPPPACTVYVSPVPPPVLAAPPPPSPPKEKQIDLNDIKSLPLDVKVRLIGAMNYLPITHDKLSDQYMHALNTILQIGVQRKVRHMTSKARAEFAHCVLSTKCTVDNFLDNEVNEPMQRLKNPIPVPEEEVRFPMCGVVPKS